jgi:hypothetical protein
MSKGTETKQKKRLVKRSKKSPEPTEPTEPKTTPVKKERKKIQNSKKKSERKEKDVDDSDKTVDEQRLCKSDVSTKQVEKKEKKKEIKKTRKINSKPLTSEKTGINVSPAKVKNIISNHVLNNDIYKAINELKFLERSEKPISDMSEKTKLLVSELNNEITKTKQKQYEKNKYETLSSDEKERYTVDKNVFKASLTKYDKCIFNNMDDTSNKTKEFNLSFDSKYYDDFSCDLSYADDYSQLIKAIAKSKYRFSNNSRLYLSSFIELLIRQIAYNSIYTCIKNDRKIIQVEHNLDKNEDLTSDEYSLFNLIRNLNVSKNYELKDDTAGTILLENLTKENQHQFKYYISETCREIKQTLSDKYPEKDGVYNHTSISKNFKNYGSAIVCEVLIIIGQMIKIEIESRSVKTVNDVVIKTILCQLHLSNNIEFKNTSDFINSISKKYNEYTVLKKIEKNKNALEKSTDVTEIKLDYELDS